MQSSSFSSIVRPMSLRRLADGGVPSPVPSALVEAVQDPVPDPMAQGALQSAAPRRPTMPGSIATQFTAAPPAAPPPGQARAYTPAPQEMTQRYGPERAGGSYIANVSAQPPAASMAPGGYGPISREAAEGAGSRIVGLLRMLIGAPSAEESGKLGALYDKVRETPTSEGIFPQSMREFGREAYPYMMNAATIKGVGLPMDEAARMARAKEMGFDFDTRLYRGQADDYAQSKASERGRFGPGVYASEQPGVAGRYGDFVAPLVGPQSDAIFSAMPGWNTLDAVARDRIIAQLTPEEAAKLAQFEKWYGKDAEAFWESLRRVSGDERATEAIANAGFKGIRGIGDGAETVIFDPKNVRSRFAAFDPARRNSADLLAGVAGAGVLAPVAAEYLSGGSNE